MDTTNVMNAARLIVEPKPIMDDPFILVLVYSTGLILALAVMFFVLYLVFTKRISKELLASEEKEYKILELEEKILRLKQDVKFLGVNYQTSIKNRQFLTESYLFFLADVAKSFDKYNDFEFNFYAAYQAINAELKVLNLEIFEDKNEHKIATTIIAAYCAMHRVLNEDTAKITYLAANVQATHLLPIIRVITLVMPYNAHIILNEHELTITGSLPEITITEITAISEVYELQLIKERELIGIRWSVVMPIYNN
jgi:hypothetical protein